MPRYSNENTGDVVEYDEPSPRLEALPNWERLDEPEHAAPEPTPAAVHGAHTRVRTRKS